MNTEPKTHSAIKTLTIATRESPLALWQANFVRSQLLAAYPDLQIELLGMTTQGDRILDITLNKIGGKGLFVKELEQALMDGRADLAVHSLKDVTMSLPENLMLSAILSRHDARDAWVSSKFERIENLPEGGVVGTSSLRRESQLRAQFPHLVFRPLRGNVQTRLKKLDAGEFDGIILAVAGLERLGLGDRIRARLPIEMSLPAAGQGALGIEICAHRQEVHALLQCLHDRETAACVTAERALSRQLGGSCQVPLAAYATLSGEELYLQSLIAYPDAREVFRAQIRGHVSEAEQLGERCAAQLRALGADAILAEIAAH